jgi:uncharacterized protein (TIGR03086 family)
MSAEPISQLSQAIDLTGQVVAGVSAGQWTSQTPCTDWKAGDLVRHLVTGNFGFAAIVRGEPRPAVTELPAADADLPGAYRDSGAALVEAFSEPGTAERIISSPIGEIPGSVALHLRVIETLVHGWDLAAATGQSFAVPDALAESEIVFSQTALEMLPPDRRPFAAPQAVAPDAPAIDRLAACLGRDVSTSR